MLYFLREVLFQGKNMNEKLYLHDQLFDFYIFQM